MIQIGDRVPEATFKVMTADGPANRTTAEVFDGKRVLLFAVPGAFTPTCHKNHLPGYVEHYEAIRARGVDAVVCTAVNDVFVLDAWSKVSGADGKIKLLADGNGDFAKALDLTFDGSGFGLGVRSKRYAMLVENGTVTQLEVEDSPSKAEASSAENMIQKL